MTETAKRTTKVWAHRGASGYKPENTLEAFELAIKQGADGIELDVHTSADGELIVMHDETVDRVTDGTGLIKDMTLAQLKELKVSTPAEPTGIYRVPTLAEVLDLMRTTDMMVNIELKNSICFSGVIIEEKITSNGKLDARKAYNTLGISMTICLLNGGLILYAGDQRPILLILAIIIFALDIFLTIRYVNSGRIDRK